MDINFQKAEVVSVADAIVERGLRVVPMAIEEVYAMVSYGWSEAAEALLSHRHSFVTSLKPTQAGMVHDDDPLPGAP